MPHEASSPCVQESWSEHKKVHQKPASDGWAYATKRGRGRSKAMPTYNWTGSLRPYRISPTSEVPLHCGCSTRSVRVTESTALGRLHWHRSGIRTVM